MRFQIDKQREELKKRIDDIALAMIDQTKKSEENYLSQLGERISSVDVSQSLETELNLIQELFRNSNLIIQTIREMQQKQEEYLNEIQLKLDEKSQVKDGVKATHFFIPNLTFFNQEEIYMFGSIKNMILFKRIILNGE
jgi:phosphopantothenate synthetase